MVAFSFKPQFAPMIVARTKIQTVRQSHRCEPGDMMQLYTGLRTRYCKKVIPDVACTLVDYVNIAPDFITFGNADLHPDAEGFAKLDGFESFSDMLKFFWAIYNTERLQGFVHRWQP